MKTDTTAYLLTAQPPASGVDLYVNSHSHIKDGSSWVSNPRVATVYTGCREALRMQDKIKQRADWPAWARSPRMVLLAEVEARINGDYVKFQP